MLLTILLLNVVHDLFNGLQLVSSLQSKHLFLRNLLKNRASSLLLLDFNGHVGDKVGEDDLDSKNDMLNQDQDQSYFKW